VGVSREETPALEGDFPRSQNDKKMTPTHIITSNNNQKKKLYKQDRKIRSCVNYAQKTGVFTPTLLEGQQIVAETLPYVTGRTAA
jgi:hypothetical protein